jgi:ubiquinone/menaquinone biosynthesis C-methylase UbiE
VTGPGPAVAAGRARGSGYPRSVFSPNGPSLRELCVQALSSVQRGYDLLAPKFDHTPFRTPEVILGATAEVLSTLGPFDRGLDVCCGTGAGIRVLAAVCRGRLTGVDFSEGMLAQARAAYPQATLVQADARALPFVGDFDLAVSFGALGHFLPAERPAVIAGVYRALRPGGLFAFPAGVRPSPASVWYWAALGFDVVMRARNAVWRPQFVMYYRTNPLPAMREDLVRAGFTVDVVDLAVSVPRRSGPRYRLVLARKPAGP